MVRPTSYTISLTFKCQSTVVILDRPPAVAVRILGNKVSVLPSYRVSGCCIGIGSLDFSKFWHGARKPYVVVRDTAGDFTVEKTFFAPKIGEIGQK